MSRRRCARLMRAQGLRGKKRPRRWPHKTNSRHGRPVAPNLTAQHAPSGPDQVWVTDITFVATTEGWLYVASILDGWSRRVLGWSCSVTLHTPLVLAALARRQPRPGLIHHSDRGCKYVETTYRALLQDHGFPQSMSGAGNCHPRHYRHSLIRKERSRTS